MADQKSALRRVMRGWLRDLSAESRAVASAEICRHLTGGVTTALGVGSFAALPGEPDLAAWHAGVRRRGTWLAFPCVLDDGGLEFRVVDDDGDWRIGPQGLRQPDPERCRLVAPDEIGLQVVPGLAFTRDGVRLGRGGGSYDRWLARCPPTTAIIGVAFAGQIVDALPHGSHDRRVGRVVTERGWLDSGEEPDR